MRLVNDDLSVKRQIVAGCIERFESNEGIAAPGSGNLTISE